MDIFQERFREAGLETTWQPTYNAGANSVSIRLREADLDKPVVQDPDQQGQRQADEGQARPGRELLLPAWPECLAAHVETLRDRAALAEHDESPHNDPRLRLAIDRNALSSDKGYYWKQIASNIFPAYHLVVGTSLTMGLATPQGGY
jgi:hypothetical protein